MKPDHFDLRQLVLGYEELTGQERQTADAHLKECCQCRELLHKLQKIEMSARIQDDIQLDNPLSELSENCRQQAKTSLESLLAKHSSTTSANKLFSWKAWPAMAIAATVLLVLFVPSYFNTGVIDNMKVGSPYVMRDADPAPANKHGVSFQLTRPGYPVLIHIDGSGQPRQIYPTPGTTPELATAERWHYLPTPPVGVQNDQKPLWRANITAGPESYLLAISENIAPSSEILAKLLEDFSSQAALVDRETLINNLSQQLDETLGMTKRINISPSP